MKLLPNEAYLTKTNKIKLPDQPKDYLILTNPIKGVFSEVENRIYQILELNNLLVLDLEFSGNRHIYLSQVGIDHEKHKGVYVYYKSKQLLEPNEGYLRTTEWNDISKVQYMDKDMILRGVIVKGHR